MAGAFIAIGHEPQSEIVDGLVETDDEGYVKTEGKSTRTNLPGVFAAGDLVRPHLPPGRHRRGLRLSGRARRRVVPARQPRCSHPRGARGHRRPGGAAVGAGRALLASALAAAALAGCGGGDEQAGATLPGRAGHDRVLHARLQGRRGDPEGQHVRRRGQAADARLARRARRLGRARAGRRGPRRARRHLHPLDGLGHRRRDRRRPGARRPVPGRAPRTARTRPARTAGRRPARPRATTPHHYIFSLYALDKGPTLEPGASPEDVTATLEGRARPRHLHRHLQSAERAARARCTRAPG